MATPDGVGFLEETSERTEVGSTGNEGVLGCK